MHMLVRLDLYSKVHVASSQLSFTIQGVVLGHTTLYNLQDQAVPTLHNITLQPALLDIFLCPCSRVYERKCVHMAAINKGCPDDKSTHATKEVYTSSKGLGHRPLFSCRGVV